MPSSLVPVDILSPHSVNSGGNRGSWGLPPQAGGDTLTLTENSAPKYVGFFVVGVLGLIWIAYQK